MKFADFENIVKSKYPNAEVFKHGEFAGSKINVAIIFDATNPFSKAYRYNGTYVDVLNKLGFQACYKHDVKSVENTIAMLQRTHGEEGFFGDIIDNTESIGKYQKILDDMLQMIICD